MLNHLSLMMNRGLTPLFLRLPEILSGMDDHELHGRFIKCALEAHQFYTLPNPELAIGKAIEHFRLIQDRDAEAGLLIAIAAYYYECAGDYKRSEDIYWLALSVASECNSDTAKVRPLAGLAMMEWHRGNYSRALQLAQDTYRIARVSGNARGELNGIRLQALCYLSMGDFKHVMELLDEGKELVVRAGVQGGQMEYLLMSIEATVYQDKTEYSDARRVHEAILRQTSAILSPVDHAYALANIAFLDILTGASTDSVSLDLDAATTGFQNGKFSRGISFCEICRAELLLCAGDATGARVEYMRFFATARSSDNDIACYCASKLADPMNPVHAVTESARWAVVFLALALCPLVRSPLMVHQALQRLGDVLVKLKDHTALSILLVALEGFTLMDVHQSRAECMRTIGDIYVQCGDLFQAQEMWEAARPLFKRSEQKKQVIGIDERLQMLDKLVIIPKVELLTPQATLCGTLAQIEKQRNLT
ncbi:hypothetical protein B0H14DRAFT_1075825 [Mycena olivaceomarginata]|nr:hypothetical protein B0H14DRAFT_1075825 [Mycena olivaceomarginata]